jgi:hypothetical protein
LILHGAERDHFLQNFPRSKRWGKIGVLGDTEVISNADDSGWCEKIAVDAVKLLRVFGEKRAGEMEKIFSMRDGATGVLRPPYLLAWMAYEF